MGDNLWSSIKENAELVRKFFYDKISALDIGSSTTAAEELPVPVKISEMFSLNKTFGKQTTQSTGKKLKEFIIENRQNIVAILARLLGLGVSVAVTYVLYKWMLNNMDPTSSEKKGAKQRAEKLLKEIGIKDIELNEYELLIASNIIAPQNIDVSWDDIGGLEEVITDLKETVIYPLKANINQARSRLIQAPKGVLLFGPPGNAKTMIAKALAKESGARFINIQVSTLFDKWYGESQKRTDAIFSLAYKIQPVIIFIDEIDSFLRSRKSVDHEATLMMKTQFMTLWDGLSTTQLNNRIMIIGATNRPQDVDPAILRRMPALFNIGMPNLLQRIKILRIILKDELVDDDVSIEEIANAAFDFSGSDLKELCRCAAMNAFVAHMKRDEANGANEEACNDEEEEENRDEEKIKLTKADFDVAFEKLAVKRLTVKKDPESYFDL